MPRPSAGTIVLGVLCLGALGIATELAASALPPAWSPYLWLAWPAMPVLLGAAAVIEVRRSQVGSGADSPRARVVLLDRVYRYWVRGVLEQSLPGGAHQAGHGCHRGRPASVGRRDGQHGRFVTSGGCRHPDGRSVR